MSGTTVGGPQPFRYGYSFAQAVLALGVYTVMVFPTFTVLLLLFAARGEDYADAVYISVALSIFFGAIGAIAVATGLSLLWGQHAPSWRFGFGTLVGAVGGVLAAMGVYWGPQTGNAPLWWLLITAVATLALGGFVRGGRS